MTPQGPEKSEEAAKKSRDENSKTMKAPVVAGPSLGEQEKKDTVAASTGSNMFKNKWIILTIIAVIAVAIVVAVWMALKPSGPGAGFVSGNGRIEATEIDVATKLAGRVQNIMVNEGDFVQAGQPLAQMQVDVLDAQRDEARAQSRQAVNTVATDEAQVAALQSVTAAAQATLKERESDLDIAQRTLARSEKLAKVNAVALELLDQNRASARSASDAVIAAQAEKVATEATVRAAQAQVFGARSGVAVTEATVARVEADIRDSQLKSPREGRVQFRIAQPGEVLPGGGKVLNLVDLSDVYMTFFLPETAVGKVALGSEARIVLDAVPQYVIPATVSFVDSTAQFTPKTVETASERQKLMFRVKANISRDLLQKHLKQIKTGLPGVTWLKLDPQAKWPANLDVNVPE
jgi:HlyD family secretion protein